MAIVIERVITVKNNIATLDNPLYLYTGDGDITCLFTIKEIKKSAKFGQINTSNLITEGVGYGEVRIYKPDDQLVFTSRAEIIDDKLQALFSFENIDQLTEAGIHQLQIHLYDADTGERNRFTIPPVELNVLFPVGTTTSLTGQATVGYAMAKEGEEPLNTFNTDGSYNRTEWSSGDTITANKLNKIEDALYEINAADADFVTTMDLNNALVYKANANHSHSEYVEKNNLPFIPTKVSQLTNDAGYITEIPDEFITETELDAKLDEKNYANESFVISKINDAQLSGGSDGSGIDLSAYALKDDLADYVTNVALNEKDYANKAYVDNAIENIDMSDVDLSNYVAKENPAITGYLIMNRDPDSTATIGNYSVALGYLSNATGVYSYAEGVSTNANGNGSHAEGASTNANGTLSHAEGASTNANGYGSHAEGNSTIASGACQHVQGQFNIEDTEEKYAHIVGNGTTNANRKNAHTLDWDGNAWFAGNVKIGTDNEELATINYVDNAINNIDISESDLSNYATKADLNNKADSTHTHEEYALKTEIPTDISAFNNDTGYLTEHQSLDGLATKEDLNSKADSIHTHEEYALKTDIPTVPTNVSEFTNDKGYVVSDDIVRIKMVTSYPETQEEGVLYIKVSE